MPSAWVPTRSLWPYPAGITFGRNIWQSSEPARIIRALKHILHENGSVDGALHLLDEWRKTKDHRHVARLGS
jgi:hypothetical protein